MTRSLRSLAAAIVAAGIVLSGGSVAVAAPAAPIRCAAAETERNTNGTFDVRVGYTSVPKYSGKPFSFKLTVIDKSFTNVRYRTFTYVGTARSFRTPVIKRQRLYANPEAHMVQAWQSGQPCTDWVS